MFHDGSSLTLGDVLYGSVLCCRRILIYNKSMSMADTWRKIPQGARIVVRVQDGVDEMTGRTQFRDFVGHVREVSETSIILHRDAAANGSRPAEIVSLELSKIVRLKPVPERPDFSRLAQRPGA